MTNITPPGPPMEEPEPPREQLRPPPGSPYAAPVSYGSYGRFPAAPVQPPPPSKAMAGWALGLSIADCCGIGALVGIGLGVTVLRRSRDGRDHGKGLAIAAVIIGAVRTLLLAAYIVLVVVLGVTGLLDDPERDSNGVVTDSGWLSNQDLRVGDCFNDNAAANGGKGIVHTSGTVEVVPCSEPHQFETYLRFDMPGGRPYPGHKAVQRAAVRCLTEFRSYVGAPWRRHGRLDVLWYYPTEENWADGEHGITCSLYATDGSELTGSQRHTGNGHARHRGTAA